MQNETYTILVVTQDSSMNALAHSLLLPPVFDVVIVSDENDARRKCAERNFTIIVVDSKDGREVDFCMDISDSSSAVMVLVPNALFEHISYRVETCGIITFVRPFDAFSFYTMIKSAIAVQYKIKSLTVKAYKLKEKMEEIRIINHAKLILVQTKNMTENDAHHYIEKEAMNRCIKKRDVADEIINTAEK